MLLLSWLRDRLASWRSGRAWARSAVSRGAIVLPAVAAIPAAAVAEQASQPSSPAAGQIDVSGGGDISGHTCAVLSGAGVRCWGYGADGRLGYGSTTDVGDDEAVGSAGPVQLGPGRTAAAISAGGRYTCARLEEGGVRCWGYAASGRLGYCNPNDIGDDELPGAVGPIALETVGPGYQIPAGAVADATPATAGSDPRAPTPRRAEQPSQRARLGEAATSRHAHVPRTGTAAGETRTKPCAEAMPGALRASPRPRQRPASARQLRYQDRARLHRAGQ